MKKASRKQKSKSDPTLSAPALAKKEVLDEPDVKLDGEIAGLGQLKAHKLPKNAPGDDVDGAPALVLKPEPAPDNRTRVQESLVNGGAAPKAAPSLGAQAAGPAMIKDVAQEKTQRWTAAKPGASGNKKCRRRSELNPRKGIGTTSDSDVSHCDMRKIDETISAILSILIDSIVPNDQYDECVYVVRSMFDGNKAQSAPTAPALIEVCFRRQHIENMMEKVARIIEQVVDLLFPNEHQRDRYYDACIAECERLVGSL